jgi:hypothetical protein
LEALLLVLRYHLRIFLEGLRKITKHLMMCGLRDKIRNRYFTSTKYECYSVGIALGYVLDDRGSRVRFPVGGGNFSLHHRVQNGSGAHPASYPVDTRGSFPGGKAVGA